MSSRLGPGTVLDSYRLDDVLGEGAMGIVYAATHLRLGRRVAIKMLRSEYTDNPQALSRFFAEARAVNKIAHPNIIEVTDFVERPGQDNYYVMELLEGVSLAEHVEAGGILKLSRAAAIMTQVAKALEAVHHAGIVHRDLKPHNIILIDKVGQPDFVKLVDFGLARLVDGSGDISLHDSTGNAVVGTPRYMSPEQASGRAVDYRSDIYTFGAVLYELVTGRPPLVGADFGDLVVKLRTVVPPPPRSLDNLPHEIPPSLDRLITECLAKDPADRPERMEKVTERLLAIADEQEWIVYELSVLPTPAHISSPKLQAVPEPIAAPPPVATPRTRWLWPVVGLIVALAVAGAAVFVMTRPQRQPQPQPTDDTHAKVEAEIATADQRIAAGRFVAPGGDEALDHLLVARKLDPEHAGVHQRLAAIARKFEQLAEEARAAGSLAEAAAHLQTVLVIEPNNAAATTKMNEIEQEVLARQRKK